MRKVIGYLVLIVLLFLAVGLLSTSYSASVALLLGILLAWPTKVIIKAIVAHMRSLGHQERRVLFLIAFLLLLVICSLYLFSFTLSLRPPTVDEYQVIIEQLDSQTFRVQENVIIEETTTVNQESKIEEILVSLPERTVKSASRGLLLKELQIAPLKMSSSGYISLTLPSGNVLRGSLCRDYCPKSRIELLDFPTNSFYAAKDAQDIERFPYVNTESITWSVRNLEKGVIFAYIPSPYHYLRPILQPFVEASSIGQWAIALVSIIGTLVLTPIVQPVLTDLAQNRLKSLFKKAPPERSGKKASLIISSKGEEKEIEIDE